jgi:hypothetical protein
MLNTCAHAIALWLTTLACLSGWAIDAGTMHGIPPGELPWLWALSIILGALSTARAPLAHLLPTLIMGALLGSLILPALQPLWPSSLEARDYLSWRALALIPWSILLRATFKAKPLTSLNFAALAWLSVATHGLLSLHRSATHAEIGVSALMTAGLAALPALARLRDDRGQPRALARRAALGLVCAIGAMAPLWIARALDQEAPEALLAHSAFYRDPAFLLAHKLQRAMRELTEGTASLLLSDWLTLLAPLRPPRYSHAVWLTSALLTPLLALALAWGRAVSASLAHRPSLPLARAAIWCSAGALALLGLITLWWLPELPMRPHTALALRWGLAALPWLGAALCATHVLMGLDAPWSALASVFVCWGAVLPLGVATTLPAPRTALVLVAAASAMTTWIALRRVAAQVASS